MPDAMLMKGHALKKSLKHLNWPMIIEPKEDEVRCRVLVEKGHAFNLYDDFTVRYMSYAEKPLHNLERFDAKWIELARRTGVYEFDTGFHVQDFDTTYRWVRSSKGLKPDLLSIGPSVPKFILFDLPTCDLPFQQRLHRRSTIWGVAQQIGLNVTVPQYAVVPNLEVALTFYRTWRAGGLEGAMLKDMFHLYQRKRTYDWVKLKPCEDADGVIFDLVEAVSDTDDPEKGLFKGKRLGRIGSVGIRMEDGSEAYAHGIKHDLGREMFLKPERFLGEWAELEFMERDRQGGYRHPVFKRLREAKA